jgi:3-methyladenine DNA glycosylase AlkD
MNAEECLRLHREAFEPWRDEARAREMRAYLRDQFAFIGLPAPVRRELVKDVLRAQRSRAELLASAHALWAMPEREYRYAAIDLLARGWRLLTPEDVPELIALANQQPWWETVDGLAGVVSDVLQAQAIQGQHEVPVMEEALASNQMWSRRIGMLHQLGWRAQTDEPRLFRYALTVAPEAELFIRKAIGWALRDYAKTAPQAVQGFIKREGQVLSPLSSREALKGLKRMNTRP